MRIATVFGLIFAFIGFVNTFWGNDPYLGLFIILVAFFYLTPAAASLDRRLRGTPRQIIQILLGFVVIWISLGVGDLESKVRMMLINFPYPNITGI